MESEQTVRDFAKLFDGRIDAYGTGAGRVVREPLYTSLYESHLRGIGEGLGVFPVRDDATVSFGAIDLDEPDFAAARTMADLIPGQAWIEESRSGNAHVWVFFEPRAEAWVARAMLRQIAEAAGKPRAEVFPKQDRLREKGSVGNYINLPYFGDTRPVRKHGTSHFDLPDFVKLALSGRINPDDWRTRLRYLGITEPVQRESASEWGTQPFLHRCAERIIRERETNPIRAGHRNVVYFNLSKQLLNWEVGAADPEFAWEQVKSVNDASPDPVAEGELRRIFNNALTSKQTSTGCDDPIMSPYIDPDCPIARGAQN